MHPRLIAAALIVVGAVLLIFGVNGWIAVSSGAVGGALNIKSIVMLLLGILSLFFGSVNLCNCK